MFKSSSIIYEDDDLIAIFKPSGLLSIPDRYNIAEESMKSILEEKFGKIFVVHRLDKDTSGIVLFAKNAPAHRHLSLQFENRTVERLYHIIVAGTMFEDKMTIDIPLMPHPSKKGMSAPSSRGKESITEIRVIERFKHATFLETRLITGRQHQIRAHLAAVGNPLLVDAMYGNKSGFFLSSIKRRFNLKKETDEKPVISRLTMHAYRLGFQHPADNKFMELSADYPKDFRALMQVLRKYSSLGQYSN